MRDWSPGRVVWVTDRGFSSRRNRRYLQRGAGHYIIAEKLRSDSADIKTALSRQGHYQVVAGNLQVKEVRIDGAGDRFIICYNPDAATRDAATRAGLLARLDDLIAGSGKLSATKRAELRGKISAMPGLNRFLRVTPGGLLRIDKARIKAGENLDGKYLLRSSDPELSAEDIALGCKQLLQVERGWRDMKPVLDLRPVYHRLEERIRAHVILCWLALLLIRIIETTTGETWPAVRRHLDRLHAGTFTGPPGTFRQWTELTKAQTGLLPSSPSPRPGGSSTSNPPDKRAHRPRRIEKRPCGVPDVTTQVTPPIRCSRPPNYAECRLTERPKTALPVTRRDSPYRKQSVT